MDWLIDELPTIVADGAFGKNCSFVSFDQDKNLAGQDQYMSTVIFGRVNTSDGSQHPVVIKLKFQNQTAREYTKCDLQFHNEIIMYEKIIPFLLACRDRSTSDAVGPALAQFYFGRNSFGGGPNKDCIILKNVTPLGYRLCEERLFVDYDHVVNALQALAKFHGLSYIAKHLDPDGFQKTIADIRDTQWNSDGQWIFSSDNALRRFGKRGVDRLSKRDPEKYRDHVHVRRFNDLVDDGDNSLRRSLRAREPTAVLCHGDFCRNNVLFRYDAAGRPVDSLLFDLATPRYGSPALDLSFFLYLNTAQGLREARWDDVLDEYCSALAEAVPDGVPVPDRCQIDAEMASSALFGFAHVSFFLPYQMEENRDKSFQDGVVLTPDEAIATMLTQGGEEATERVADVVQHFVDMGYTNV